MRGSRGTTFFSMKAASLPAEKGLIMRGHGSTAQPALTYIIIIMTNEKGEEKGCAIVDKLERNNTSGA